MTEAEEIGRQASRTAAALAALTVALLVVAAVVVWAEIRTTDPFDPLHYDVPQTVTSRVNILSGAPAAQLGDTVDVTGTKCADEDVDTIAVTSWKPIDPRGGSIVTSPAHAASRDSGCMTNRYRNDIPPEVAEIVRRQHARGYPAPLWEIRGVETPIDDEGRQGTPETWYTEPFALVAR